MTDTPERGGRRLVRAGETFDSDEDYELELPDPTPEPDDIDRVSREHRGEAWEQWKREHGAGGDQ
jgi:hypothetical protein